MPLTAAEIDVEDRKHLGRAAAEATQATSPKAFGQTSEANFPYTYWWIVGYNEAVSERM